MKNTNCPRRNRRKTVSLLKQQLLSFSHIEHQKNTSSPIVLDVFSHFQKHQIGRFRLKIDVDQIMI